MQFTESISQWLDEVCDMNLYQAVSRGCIPISLPNVLTLIQECEWGEIIEDSRIDGVYPYYLRIGIGDYREWCRSGGKSETDRAFHISARLPIKLEEGHIVGGYSKPMSHAERQEFHNKHKIWG